MDLFIEHFTTLVYWSVLKQPSMIIEKSVRTTFVSYFYSTKYIKTTFLYFSKSFGFFYCFEAQKVQIAIKSRENQKLSLKPVEKKE